MKQCFVPKFYAFTSVNTDEAVDQDKQGTSTRGLGQFDAASEAIYEYIMKYSDKA